MTYLALSVWAYHAGRSYERAKLVCELGKVPAALPFVSGIEGRTSYLVPEGTPWPDYQPEAPPEGYITLSAWAKSLRKNVRTVRARLYHQDIPEAIRFGTQGHYCVPEGLPWPGKRPGRPSSIRGASFEPAREAA